MEHFVNITFDVDKLLSSARQKLCKQGDFTKTFANNQDAIEEINECLSIAKEELLSVCQPKVFFTLLDAKCKGDHVIVGQTNIQNTPMAQSLNDSSKVFAYLITLDYDSEMMLKNLKYDYVIYHFQHILGREVLFDLGRQVHTAYVKQYADFDFRRHSIRMRKESFDDSIQSSINYWNPKMVASLVEHFSDTTIPISVKESGCFSPLQTILGVMVANKK